MERGWGQDFVSTGEVWQEEEVGDREIDNDACNIHEGGDEWSGARGGVEMKAAQKDGQHGTYKASPYNDTHQTSADGERKHHVFGSIIFDTKKLPCGNAQNAEGRKRAPQ